MKSSKNFGLVIAILALLSTWNFVAWTSVDPVVIELVPETNRKPASIEEPRIYEKKVSSETLKIKCGEEIQHQTNYSQIRLEFHECEEVLSVKNITNHFQASLWQKEKNWKSDYIPLNEADNQITYRHPASDRHYRIQIERTNESDDAK